MPSCYFLIGPPGCGKSTWVETNKPSLRNPVVVSSDAILEREAKARGASYADMFGLISFTEIAKSLRADITRAVLAGHDIILDRTNCTVEDRLQFTASIPSSYERVGVLFEYDRDELRARVVSREKSTGKHVPLSVIDLKIAEYVAPFPGEFDRLVEVSR